MPKTGIGQLGHQRAILLNRYRETVEVTPFTTLNRNRISGVFPLAHTHIEKPDEIATVNIAVAQFEKMTGNQLHICRNFVTAVACYRRWNDFVAHKFAHDDLLITRPISDRCLQNIGGPEVAKTAHCNQPEQADHHDHAQGNGTTIEPDPR